MRAYDIGIRLYTLGIRIAALLGHRKASLWVSGRREFPSICANGVPEGLTRTIWFHAASLGEFEIGRPLVEETRRKHPDWRIVLTFFSPSGYQVRKNWPGADFVFYLPSDTPRNAERFIDAVRPDTAVFIKDEFWLNHLGVLQERGIPTFLVSAIFRRGDIFFKPFGGMFRRALHGFRRIFVLDEESRRLLEGIGCTECEVTGDTRNDRIAALAREGQDNTPAMSAIRQFCSGRDVFAVGSCHSADERLLVPFINRHRDIAFLITPHDINPSEIENLRSRLKEESVLLTDILAGKKSAECLAEVSILVNDTVGILAGTYRYCRWAYVGGAFGHLMHSVQEPAVFGLPVAFGPKYGKFKEASDLIAAGAGRSVSRTEHLEEWFRTVDCSKAGAAARSCILDNCGATGRISAYLENLFVEHRGIGPLTF